MKKSFKKIIALIFVLALLLSLVSFSASAVSYNIKGNNIALDYGWGFEQISSVPEKFTVNGKSYTVTEISGKYDYELGKHVSLPNTISKLNVTPEDTSMIGLHITMEDCTFSCRLFSTTYWTVVFSRHKVSSGVPLIDVLFNIFK